MKDGTQLVTVCIKLKATMANVNQSNEFVSVSSKSFINSKSRVLLINL